MNEDYIWIFGPFYKMHILQRFNHTHTGEISRF